jgi:hypothetical protein
MAGVNASGKSGAMSSKKPQAWNFERLRTADGTGFTWFLENIDAIQKMPGGWLFEVTDSGFDQERQKLKIKLTRLQATKS